MTRAILAISVLALALVPSATATIALDQLRSGSFESWSQGTNNLGKPTAVPDNWTVEIGSATQSILATDGHASAQLRALPDTLGGHKSILAQTIPQSATDVGIVPGAYYELRFDAQGVYSNKGNGNATVTWIGALGHVLRVDTVIVPDGSGFQTYDARLQAPIDAIVGDAATSVTVRFLVDGQSSDNSVNLWVDNAHFGLSTPLG